MRSEACTIKELSVLITDNLTPLNKHRHLLQFVQCGITKLQLSCVRDQWFFDSLMSVLSNNLTMITDLVLWDTKMYINNKHIVELLLLTLDYLYVDVEVFDNRNLNVYLSIDCFVNRFVLPFEFTETIEFQVCKKQKVIQNVFIVLLCGNPKKDKYAMSKLTTDLLKLLFQMVTSRVYLI